MLAYDGAEWEDLVLYATDAEAVAASIKYKSIRVEIFKRDDVGAYRPTYNYYLAGN